MGGIDWPSRDEWARQQRTFYADMVPEVSTAVAAYATPEEVEAICVKILAERNRLLKDLRAARAAAPTFRQPGETRRAWTLPYYTLSEEDQKRADVVENIIRLREERYRAVKKFRKGWIPSLFNDGYDLPELADLHACRDAARDAEIAKLQEEVAQRPIDDEAWRSELEWRVQIGDGMVVHHHRVT